MKYTDTELETILSKLIASTRSPRGRFSAVASYPQLEKRLKPHIRCLFPTRMRILAAAAAVILLCLSVGTVYLYMQPTSLQTVSTMAETRNVILPDGSSVLLNRHSSLSYPKRFKSDNREVQLTGEAYFEVSKDQKHPFIVQTEHINVQVLGTHFNVDAYRNNPEVKTTLLTGSVAVSNKSNSVRMILKPNEIAIYNKVGNKLTRQVTKNAKDEISWRDGEFIFDNLPLGEIARELIRILKGFGMEVLAYDIYPDPEYAVRAQIEYVSLDELYRRSDIISLHCPLTDATRYMIDGAAIGRMKPGVMLINTGRGQLIHTEALIEGLKEKKIGAAGLDVYEEEAAYFYEDTSDRIMDDDVLARLLSFNNVVMTSHQGFFTREALDNIAHTTLQNINDFAVHRELRNEVRAESEKTMN